MFEVLLKQLLTLVPGLATVVPESSMQPQAQQIARILQEYGLEKGRGLLAM